ncbi:MAG: tetratricopeptide repeat protein [Nitrospirales bacterium]
MRLPKTFPTLLTACFLMVLSTNVSTFAEIQQKDDLDRIAEQAEAAWFDGSTVSSLDILGQGLQRYPHARMLHKLRGDVLATSRRDHDALEEYETILQKTPGALDVRWAKWSVLLRSGKGGQAIEEFKRIAEHDPENPLIPLRMAQDLRKLDHLEESVQWYQKAVNLRPGLPGWRLAMARGRFDILDGRGARDDVKHVLTMVSPGSPEEIAARSLLSVVYGATKERGRRFQPIFSPEGTAAERKEWASIRAEAWRLFDARRYQEAEPFLRKILALKPSDHGATHDLGVTLMELDRHEEAIPILEKVLTITTKDEELADTFFRIGQSLAALERWPEALDHFEILYEAAIEFEESTKDVAVLPGIRILNKDMLAGWVETARMHVPEIEKSKIDSTEENIPPIDSSSPAVLSMEEKYEKAAAKKLKPEDPIYRRASLMGRDADFSLFRFLISANHVMRDDLPGGAHEFIPIEPSDTFPTTQAEIYMVFGLVTASFDEVPLKAECFLETAKITREQTAVVEDQVIMAMNEQSGYFVLSKPQTEWTPGLYRCGLFVGEEVSAYTHADEVRFRIVDASQSS